MAQDLLAEIARLRRENDRLVAEVGRLTWAVTGASYDLEEAFGMTRHHARIIALLMSGRWYNAEQLEALSSRHSRSVSAVAQNIFNLRKAHPRIKIATHRTWGWSLPVKSREFIRARLAELK